jgi:hypothetical protein
MLVNVIHLPITLLFILSIDDVVKGLANPCEHEILLGSRKHDMLVKRLKIRDYSSERREWDHGGEGFRLMAYRLREEHQWWRDEMFGN